jgi:hypothetical protein
MGGFYTQTNEDEKQINGLSAGFTQSLQVVELFAH